MTISGGRVRLSICWASSSVSGHSSCPSSIGRISIDSVLLVAGAACAALGAFVLALHFPPAKQAHALPYAEMRGFLRSPLVLALAALLFFQSGVEFTLGGFVSSYLTHDIAASVTLASVTLASWILAAYWASIMVSRAALSRIALGMDPYRILLFCALGACAGAVLAAVAPGPGISTFAIVLCGFSLAGIYPTAVGVAGERFKSHSGTAFGILFAAGLSGGIVLPWLAGQIGGGAGLRWILGMVAASFAVILALSRLAVRCDRAISNLGD